MNFVNKNRWQVRIAALLIFLLGAAAGAFALSAYHSWFKTSGQLTRQDRFEQMNERLQLGAEQRTQVQQIFGDTRAQLQALRKESEPRVAEIRRQADERLQQVLTAEQWRQFQQLRDESQGTRQRDRNSGGNDSHP